MHFLETEPDQSGIICCSTCVTYYRKAKPKGPQGQTWYTVVPSGYNRFKESEWARSYELTEQLTESHDKKVAKAKAQREAKAKKVKSQAAAKAKAQAKTKAKDQAKTKAKVKANAKAKKAKAKVKSKAAADAAFLTRCKAKLKKAVTQANAQAKAKAKAKTGCGKRKRALAPPRKKQKAKRKRILAQSGTPPAKNPCPEKDEALVAFLIKNADLRRRYAADLVDHMRHRNYMAKTGRTPPPIIPCPEIVGALVKQNRELIDILKEMAGFPECELDFEYEDCPVVQTNLTDMEDFDLE